MDRPLDPLIEAVLRVRRAEQAVEIQRGRVRRFAAAGQTNLVDRGRDLLNTLTERLAIMRELLELEYRADEALRTTRRLLHSN